MYLLYSSICSSVFCIFCKLGTVFRDLIKFGFIWQVALSYFTRRHMMSNFCSFLNVNISQSSMFGSISSLGITKWWCLILPFPFHLLARKLISRCFPSSTLWLPNGAVQDMLDSFSVFTTKIMNWFLSSSEGNQLVFKNIVINSRTWALIDGFLDCIFSSYFPCL